MSSSQSDDSDYLSSHSDAEDSQTTSQESPNHKHPTSGDSASQHENTNVPDESANPSAEPAKSSAEPTNPSAVPGESTVTAVEEVKEDEEDEEIEEIEEIMSEEVIQERRVECADVKQKGNIYFKEARFEEAMYEYSDAMQICPKSCPKDMAVLLSNRAACHMKMQDNKAALQDCTDALELDPLYIKVRMRKAQVHEQLEQLEDALKEYNTVLEYDRSNKVAFEAVMRLPREIEVQREKLKEEMMGKLKELGNMCLKPFGLSTENFKFEQDPNSGGYSVNFQK